jgi:ssDNA-specific exonuclease RecJ
MGTDPTAAKRKPWMPASVEKQYKQLYFKFIKAEHLPIMDTFGTIDAFVELDHAGTVIRTKVFTMQDNLVTWD